MSYIAFVVDRDGTPLMPTTNPKRVRKLLKSGRAEIYKHHPFTIRRLCDGERNTQPIELAMDAGQFHIGVSIKSEKHEYVAEQRDNLPDEKAHHEAQRMYRRTRRNRKRYRTPRFDNRKTSKKPGWLAPSVRHEMENHLRIVEMYKQVCPITSVTVEVATFDTQLVETTETGKPVPQGTDYQHGMRYGYDTLREAVFARDNYTCICCGSTIGAIKTKSGYKTGKVVLQIHHLGYWKGDRTNRAVNLATVCSKCNTPANHKKGCKLWGLEPILKPLRGAAFMNSVRWQIVEQLKQVMGADVEVHTQFGVETKRERHNRNLEKSHANDAYCIGSLHPRHRVRPTHYVKRRRNNRCLEKFYDAKVIDVRTGEAVKGASLGCERTNRSEHRNSEKSLRKFRGPKVSKGRRNIQRKRYPAPSGSVISFEGKTYIAGSTYHYGEYTLLKGQLNSRGKPLAVKTSLIQVLSLPPGWVTVT